jgi:hypothetical protein
VYRSIDEESVRCKGKTQSGGRCKIMTSNPNGLCWCHDAAEGSLVQSNKKKFAVQLLALLSPGTASLGKEAVARRFQGSYSFAQALGVHSPPCLRVLSVAHASDRTMRLQLRAQEPMKNPDRTTTASPVLARFTCQVSPTISALSPVSAAAVHLCLAGSS